MTADNKRMVTQVHVNFAKAIAAYEYTLVSRDAAFDAFMSGNDAAISPAAKRGPGSSSARRPASTVTTDRCSRTGCFTTSACPRSGTTFRPSPTATPGRANCDCSRGAEKGTCLPAGGWSGLLKLSASKDSTDASGNPVTNYNNFRRDSTWSDGAPDQSFIDQWYSPPTDATLKGAWRTPSLRDVAITAPYMHDGLYKTLEDVLWHYNVGGSASGAGQFSLPTCAPDTMSDPDAGAPCLPADAGVARPLHPDQAARAHGWRDARPG